MLTIEKQEKVNHIIMNRVNVEMKENVSHDVQTLKSYPVKTK